MLDPKPEPAKVHIEPPFALPTGGGLYEFRNNELVPVELTNQDATPAGAAPAAQPKPGKAVALNAAPATPGA